METEAEVEVVEEILAEPGEATCERYLAYFDIMGFKDRISRESHQSIDIMFEKMLNILPYINPKITKVRPTSFRVHFSRILIVSDTVLFYSRDSSPDALAALSLQASYFLFSCLGEGIPVRGAISKGLFTADEGRSKYFGQPLIDAYLLAESLQYYGAVLHHTAENELDNMLSTLGLNSLRSVTLAKSTVPIKDAGMVSHHRLAWTDGPGLGSAAEDSHPGEFIAHLYATASGPIRRYVDNTYGIYMEDAEREGCP